MEENMKKLLLLVLVACMLVSVVGCSQDTVAEQADEEPNVEEPTPVEKLKVAMLLGGPINDAGWNASAYDGLKLAEESMDIEIAYSENVAMPDAEAAMTDYAIAGYDLIIAHGFEFTDPAKNVAPDFTDSKFIVMNGAEAQAPNMGGYQFTTGESGFVGGYLAGLFTESNTVGIMVVNKTPKMELTKNAFVDAAKYVNPDVEVLTAYTDSWSDVAKGKEIALSMIEQGADIVACNANQVGLGSIEACKEKGIFAMGYVSDQHDVAPGTVLISVKQEVSKLVRVAIEDTLNGDFEPVVKSKGAAEGVISISPMYEYENKMTPEKQAMVDKMMSELADGTLAEMGLFNN
jgi:basic membrane protein A